mmetsp:Transcript_89634/g.159172  ORF Transcript_89634/g.159172 Transcript_89634/m.159172 type:complete len:120 (-) Transcript_89634:3159-3518(-)
MHSIGSDGNALAKHNCLKVLQIRQRELGVEYERYSQSTVQPDEKTCADVEGDSAKCDSAGHYMQDEGLCDEEAAEEGQHVEQDSRHGIIHLSHVEAQAVDESTNRLLVKKLIDGCTQEA